MNNSISISVVIPACNCESYIGRAIDSVLAQTRPADEVIVIDDGSTDGTAEIVRSYSEKVIFIQQENAGVSVARNTGIKAAAGDWIAFLDADDEWLPEKLKLQSEHLSRNPDLKWTYSNFYQKLSDSERLRPAHVSEKINELLCGGEYFEDYLQGYIKHAYAWTCTLAVHKTVFETVGLFEPGMKIAQDGDVWFRIAYVYPRVGYLSQPLSVYHLDTPGSSMKVNFTVGFMISFIERHEQLSEKYHRRLAFEGCITRMLQTWMRKLESQHRRKEAAVLLRRFNVYLPNRFQKEMWFRIRVPLGSILTDMYFWFKRKR